MASRSVLLNVFSVALSCSCIFLEVERKMTTPPASSSSTTKVTGKRFTRRHARLAQTAMGVTFAGMGVATMLAPDYVARLSLTPSSYGAGLTSQSRLFFQCFGAQAALGGLLILKSRFTRSTFKWFGLAMIPFFIFDAKFWNDGVLSNFGAFGDALGNIIFSVGSLVGYYALSDKKDEEKDSKDD